MMPPFGNRNPVGERRQVRRDRIGLKTKEAVDQDSLL